MDAERAGKMMTQFREDAMREVGPEAGPLTDVVDWLFGLGEPPSANTARTARQN